MNQRFGLLQNAIHRSLIFVRLFTTRLSQKTQPNVGYAAHPVGPLHSFNCKSLLFNYLQDRHRTGAFLRTTAPLVHSLWAEIQVTPPNV